VGLWVGETSKRVSLWESIVVFFMSACVLLHKIKDFLALLMVAPVDDFDDFFDAFATMSLDEVSLDQHHTGPLSLERQSESGVASELVGGVYFCSPILDSTSTTFGSVPPKIYTPPTS
jgi:hypothetical protein